MRPFDSGSWSRSQGSCPFFHLPLKRLKSKLVEGIEMADETKSIKMKDINEVLSDHNCFAAAEIIQGYGIFR
jgi:hypothetical protein